MIKKGFTLAEVLITITLLGVIAALTVPLIMSNMQRAQTGPALMRAIATLENANSIMMTERDFYTLKDGCEMGDENAYIDNCFDRYIKERIGATRIDTSNTEYFDWDRRSNMGAIMDYAFATKAGPTWYFTSVGGDDGKRNMRTYIDVNGIEKGPNELGKDLFILYVDIEEDGKLYAEASRSYLEKYGEGYTPGDGLSWEDGCNADMSPKDIKGEYCSGSIVDNGGKVIYNWR